MCMLVTVLGHGLFPWNRRAGTNNRHAKTSADSVVLGTCHTKSPADDGIIMAIFK